MIRKKTVFVLGAGASKPFGFPTGPELRSRLCYELHQTSSATRTTLLKSGHSEEEISRFTKAFERSGFPSIDRFLATRHKDFEQIGKLALAACIARHHDENKLYRLRLGDGDTRFGTSDWYGHLWGLMTEGAEDASQAQRENKVAFITFNYDLSLERFLFNGFLHGFGLDMSSAQKYTAGIPIHHVYGHLAAAPNERYSFAHLEKPWERVDLAGEIKVMPNQRPEDDERCGEMMAWAEQIFFLGFGYDEMNCHRLGLDTLLKSLKDRNRWVPEIAGTALGLTDQERVIASKLIGLDAWQELVNVDCLTFLRMRAARLRQ